MYLLVVVHEKKSAAFIKKALVNEGFAVDVVHNELSALTMAERLTYNLILLDMQIPNKGGFKVLKELRSKDIAIPILCFTTKDSSDELASVLDNDSDDYLIKPFAFVDLAARVRALLSRRARDQGAELRLANLRLDPEAHKVWRGNKEIKLTPKEYALLEFLMRAPNQVLTRKMLVENVWDSHFESFSNIIDVYINYLRKKIDSGFRPALLHTVPGVGYVLKDPS